MCPHILAILLVSGSLSSACGQKLLLGVVTGVGLTDDYRSSVMRGQFPPPNDSSIFVYSLDSASHGFTIGPKLELRLPRNFSVEVDALYRRFRYEETLTVSQPIQVPGGALLDSYGPKEYSQAVWQIPVLAKYSLPLGKVRPILESGVSFRPFEYGSYASRTGFAAGAGAQFRLGRVIVEPAVRYTHWHRGNPLSSLQRNDQVEFLTGFHADSQSSRPSAFGQRLSFGVVGGWGLTGDFPATALSTSEKSIFVGIMLEAALPRRFSVEIDRLYRPLSLSERRLSPPVDPPTVLTWEFPVLVKHRFPRRPVTPFAELGPSFRASGNTNGTNPSNYGLTIGVGAEVQWKKLKIAPAIRYTHWAADQPTVNSPARTIRNQVAGLVGLAF